jgi:hypothetical protein
MSLERRALIEYQLKYANETEEETAARLAREDEEAARFARTVPGLRRRNHKANPRMEKLWSAMYSALKADRPMTVRQVYYRMVVAALVPKHEGRGYNVVQGQLLLMRREGVVPYAWVIDNSRRRHELTTYSTAGEAIRDAADRYRQSMWENQPHRVEIWCEKDALSVIIGAICDRYDVPLLVTHGFSSESYLYEASKVIESHDKPTHVFHFGDYDPSGVLIDPKAEEGLLRLVEGTADITFTRVAVTEAMRDSGNWPTRPTKFFSDDGKPNPHAKDFEGDSMELDALGPAELRALVEDTITGMIDEQVWLEAEDRERGQRAELDAILRRLGMG